MRGGPRSPREVGGAAAHSAPRLGKRAALADEEECGGGDTETDGSADLSVLRVLRRKIARGCASGPWAASYAADVAAARAAAAEARAVAAEERVLAADARAAAAAARLAAVELWVAAERWAAGKEWAGETGSAWRQVLAGA